MARGPSVAKGHTTRVMPRSCQWVRTGMCYHSVPSAASATHQTAGLDFGLVASPCIIKWTEMEQDRIKCHDNPPKAWIELVGRSVPYSVLYLIRLLQETEAIALAFPLQNVCAFQAPNNEQNREVSWEFVCDHNILSSAGFNMAGWLLSLWKIQAHFPLIIN